MKDLKKLKSELQNIIAGKGSNSKGNIIEAAKTYIRTYSQSNCETENILTKRAIEERALISFAKENNLLLDVSQFGTYLTEGAEQKVYFSENDETLLKVADAIFYETWHDYFNNLLLHNFFFPDTSYSLKGFNTQGDKLYAVVEQQFVLSTSITNLSDIKEYLLANGFIHKKNNDYFHPYLGIIIEDLHDENVITNQNVLFFIDTVFYIIPSFYEPVD